MPLARLALLLTMLALPCLSHAQDAKPWRIGTWKTAQTIQPFLYEEFNPGVRAEVLPFTNPGDQKAALLAGGLDMTGTTLALAIQAAARGEPVVVVAALCNKCSALVVRKGAGIREVRDLKGKRIGYVPGTMHEILLREALSRAGLDPTKDATLMRVDFFDMGAALSKGDIDAFLSGEPLPTQAKLQGYGEILAYPYFDDAVGPVNAGMIVRRDMIEKEPEKVAAMVLAHARTTQRLMADRPLWLKEASTRFGVAPEVLEAASGNMDLIWDMDETFLRQAAALGARMKALGMIEREPDYGALFDARFTAMARGK